MNYYSWLNKIEAQYTSQINFRAEYDKQPNKLLNTRWSHFRLAVTKCTKNAQCYKIIENDSEEKYTLIGFSIKSWYVRAICACQHLQPHTSNIFHFKLIMARFWWDHVLCSPTVKRNKLFEGVYHWYNNISFTAIHLSVSHIHTASHFILRI